MKSLLSVFTAAVLVAAASAPRASAAWSQDLSAAQASLEIGDFETAEVRLRAAVGGIHNPSPIHMSVFEELQVLGAVLDQGGEPRRGARLVGEALDLAALALGADDPDLEPFWSMLGGMELRLGRSVEAVDLLERSYRVLIGRVSSENAAFQEVLQSYAEALRQSGMQTDLLVLQSHYGHEVDLTGLAIPEPISISQEEARYQHRIVESRRNRERTDTPTTEVPEYAAAPAARTRPAPAATRPPRAVQSGTPVRSTLSQRSAQTLRRLRASNPGVSNPARRAPRNGQRRRPETIDLASFQTRERTTQHSLGRAPGTLASDATPPKFAQAQPGASAGRAAPKNRHGMTKDDESRLIQLRQLLAQVPVARQAMEKHDKWVKQQLRLMRGRRKPSRQKMMRTYNEAMNRGQKMAFLATLAPRYRALETSSNTKLMGQAFRKARPHYQKFERSLNKAATGLKELIERLQKVVKKA